MKLKDIIPYINNAKEHPEWQIKQIMSSIAEFGMNDPIAVDEKNVIIEGHGRCIALERMGHEEVPVIRLGHMSEAQKKAYILAHNKLTMNTGFNIEKLKIELETLKEMDFDIDLIGFSGEELEEFDVDFEDGNAKEIEEDEPVEIGKTAYSQEGDIWILGNHRLMCGDSLSKEAVMKLMDGKKGNLIITDPPYNVDYEGGTEEKLKIKNDNMDDKSFYNFLLKSYSNMYESIEDGAGIYVFHADTEGINFRKAMIDAGFKLSQSCVWVKDTFVMGRQDYHWQHEPVLVGWKPTGPHKWYSDRKQSTVWHFDKPQRNDIHPTMKPIALIAYPMTNSSKKGDIVVDLFGGSGTTIIAAEQTGRIAYLMEQDPLYVDAAVKRYVKYAGSDKVILIRDGMEIAFEDTEIEAGE